jgi:hypothetical protein
MNSVITHLILETLGIFIISYILGAILLVISIAINQENKRLIINSNSWHFKLLCWSNFWDHYRIESFKEYGISICKYYANLFFTLVIKLPFLIFLEMTKFIIYLPFLFLFGRLPKLSLTHLRNTTIYADSLFGIEYSQQIFPEIEIKTDDDDNININLFPAWLVVPGLIIWGLWISKRFRSGVGVFIGGLIIIFIVSFLWKTFKGKQNINLTAQIIKSKLSGFCPIAKIQ